MIRELCKKKNISIAELCRQIGQTPQSFNNKLQRGTVSCEEMIKIAEVLNVGYEQAFVLPDGEKISFVCNRRTERLDDIEFEERILGIEKATAAMIEVGIEDNIIIQMLQNYWDLRLSEAKSFVQRQNEIKITY